MSNEILKNAINKIAVYIRTDSSENLKTDNQTVVSAINEIYDIVKNNVSDYEETISNSSSTWSIQHNLDTLCWKLTYKIIDDNDDIVYGDIDTNLSTNNLLVIKFREPVSGKIYIKK